MKKIITSLGGALLIAIIIFLAGKNFQESSSSRDIRVIENTVPVVLDTDNTKLMIWGGNHGEQIGGSWPVSTQRLALGSDFTLALLADGRVFSWGSNDAGQLGRDTGGKNDSIPREVSGLTNIIAISAKHKHALALDRDGNVFAFGSNFTGQIGNGGNTDTFTPQKISITDVVKIAAGHKFSLAVKKDGTLWGWGASCSEDIRVKAVALFDALGSSVANLGGGYYDSSSVAGGKYDTSEDCLNENVVGIKSKVPKKIEGIQNAQDISAGYGHALIIDNNGDVWSFGCNLYGQLGREKFDNDTPNSVPQKIPGLSGVKNISAGFRHSLAVTNTGDVYHWGISWPTDGKAINSFKTADPTLIASSAEYPEISTISTGRDFSLFISDGKVFGFGLDAFDIITPESDAIVRRPREIFRFHDSNKVVNVVAGSSHAAAFYR